MQLVYMYNVLIKKDNNIDDLEIMSLISNDARLNVGITINELLARDYYAIVEVKPGNKEAFPSELLKEEVLAFDIYVSSLNSMDHSWIENSFMNGAHSLGYEVIASKDPQKIYVNK